MAGGYRLAVDLGTTYTAAAIERDGRVEVCTLGDRTATIPSLVLVRPTGEILVGEAAQRRALSEPTGIAREFKRRLGDPAPLVLGGNSMSPEALMAAVLRHVVAIITEREGRRPDQVVLTHPANFGPYKTELMRTVGRLADVGEVELLAEPQAAAVAYAHRSVIEPGRTVAVYDFGGGTFDVALVRRGPGGAFEIVGQPEGMDRLGGIDLDQLLVEHVIDQLDVADALGQATDDATLAALVDLRDRCQAAKEALSSDADALVSVSLLGRSTTVRISRTEFERLARPRVMQTIEALQRTIRNSGLSTTDIDRVLLVGGSSRIPMVADAIRATIGRPVALDANPKTAICEGAVRAMALGSASPPAPAAAVSPTASPTPAPPAPALPPPVPPDPTPDRAPPPPMPSNASTPSESPSKRRGVLIAIAVVVVLAAAGTVVALTRGDDSTASTSSPPVTKSSAATTTARATPSTAGPTVATSAADTGASASPTAPTGIAPAVTAAAATTSVVPTGSLSVGKTIWYAGFEIAVATATYGPMPNLLDGVRVTVDALATNRADTATNFGFISLAGPVTFESGGASVNADLPLIAVSPNASAKVQITADFDTLDPNDVVIDFGGPEHNAARLPLSAGDPVTVQPATFPLSGAVTSSRGVAVTLTQALVSAYDPVVNAGGDVAQAAAGEVFVLISAHVAFDGELDDGVYQPVLVRPDGVTITATHADNALLERGGEHDDTYVFPIAATVAGNYTLQFPTARDQAVNQLPFKLG
ncbi:MAG: Hsp70 family protein [Ilumatobacteraceae bacterium]